MATKRASEFAGTEPSVDGTTGPVNPATLTGGSASGGSGGSGGDEEFDPAIHSGRDKINTDGTFRRKRGRKAGGNSAKNSHPVNIAGIESVLLSMHAMMAAGLQAPEMAIEADEAKMLAEAVAEVQRHYPMVIDPRVMAWVNLVSAAGMVYGPRVYMIRKRKIAEAEMAKEKPNSLSLVQ